MQSAIPELKMILDRWKNGERAPDAVELGDHHQRLVDDFLFKYGTFKNPNELNRQEGDD